MNSFDIMGFLEEQTEAESNQYLRNGIKKYKYRTRDEKIQHCGRVMGKTRDANIGALRPIMEWRCGIIRSGDGPDEQNVCPKCVRYTRQKKYKKALDRIDYALNGGDTIFYSVANDAKEMRDVQRKTKSSGYDYISLPIDDSGKRLVFLNAPVMGNERIVDYLEIKTLLSEATRNLPKGNISGKLGDGVHREDDADFMLRTSYGVYDIDSKKEAELDAVAIALTSDIEITKESFQDLYDLRQEIFIELVKQFDHRAVLIESGPTPIDFNFVQKTFARVRVAESGRLDLLDPDTRMALNEIKNGVMEKIEEYKGCDEGPDDLSSLGIYK